MKDLIERAKKATAYLASSDARLMRECADTLQSAQRTVAELPKYPHDSFCCSHVNKDGWGCDCGADEANAKRLAARKAVGLEG